MRILSLLLVTPLLLAGCGEPDKNAPPSPRTSRVSPWARQATFKLTNEHFKSVSPEAALAAFEASHTDETAPLLSPADVERLRPKKQGVSILDSTPEQVAEALRIDKVYTVSGLIERSEPNIEAAIALQAAVRKGLTAPAPAPAVGAEQPRNMLPLDAQPLGGIPIDKGIVGADDRVVEPIVGPWRSMLYVRYLNKKTGKGSSCSAVAIGPTSVLTAAHCVADIGEGVSRQYIDASAGVSNQLAIWQTSSVVSNGRAKCEPAITVSPFWERKLNVDAYLPTNEETVFIPSRIGLSPEPRPNAPYAKYNIMVEDFAILDFSRCPVSEQPGNQVGWMNWWADLVPGELRVSGYPGYLCPGATARPTLCGSQGPVSTTLFLFESRIDATPGMSGGPWWYWDARPDVGPTVLGVSSYVGFNPWPLPENLHTYGARLTQAYTVDNLIGPATADW